MRIRGEGHHYDESGGDDVFGAFRRKKDDEAFFGDDDEGDDGFGALAYNENTFRPGFIGLNSLRTTM